MSNDGMTNPEGAQPPTLVRPASLPASSADQVLDLDRREAQLMAFELAKTYKAFVEFYRNTYKMSAAEATAQADSLLKPSNERYENDMRHGPPQDAAWHELSHLAGTDPEAGEKRWRDIKWAALDELEKGVRSADAVEGYHAHPWDRARFIALRHSLMEQWKPTNGIETLLIEIMAQTHTIYQRWVKTMAEYMSTELSDRQAGSGEDGYYRPPRVSSYQAMEQAVAMVDRLNRLFLRTLRQLRDLRRYTPAVTIESAGQVNIASGQQMNLASIKPTEQTNSYSDQAP